MSQPGFAPANPDQGVQTSIRAGLQVRRNTKPATSAGFKGVSEWGGAELQTGCKPGFVACRYRNAALLPPAYDFGQEGPLGFLWGAVSRASILTIAEIVRQTGLSCCIAKHTQKGQSQQTMDRHAKCYSPWPMRSDDWEAIFAFSDAAESFPQRCRAFLPAESLLPSAHAVIAPNAEVRLDPWCQSACCREIPAAFCYQTSHTPNFGKIKPSHYS